ncbi:putative G-protein coupled receptor 139 [Mustelus asterias]
MNIAIITPQPDYPSGSGELNQYDGAKPALNQEMFCWIIQQPFSQGMHAGNRVRCSSGKTGPARHRMVLAEQLMLSANLVTILVLSRGNCGLSSGIVLYLVCMSTTDLLVLAFCVLHSILYSYFPFSFLFYTAACRTEAIICFTAIDCSVWLTTAFTFDRFVSICCHNLRTRYCNRRTASWVIAALCAANLLRNIPFYFKYTHYGIINGIPWGCAPRLSFFSLPGWVVFYWLHHILNPLVPYVLILVFNVLTVWHIVLSSRARKALRDRKKQVQGGDPEMVNRRRSIILLFTVSGCFVLLWLPKITVFLVMKISNNHSYPNYNHPLAIADISGTILFYLSSCTNTTIYALTQSKVRQVLKGAVKYPFTFISQLLPRSK